MSSKELDRMQRKLRDRTEGKRERDAACLSHLENSLDEILEAARTLRSRAKHEASNDVAWLRSQIESEVHRIEAEVRISKRRLEAKRAEVGH